jgi:superfamily II DNA or RNA helicase
MALTTLLATQVAKDTRDQGRQLFERGAVTRLDGDRWWMEAVVKDADRNNVELRRDRRSLLCWCTCDAFHNGEVPCPHVWAAVLAAERRGYLNGSGKKDPQYLVLDEEMLEDEPDDAHERLEDDDPYGEEAYRDSGRTSFGVFPSTPGSSSRRARQPPDAAPRGPTWKQSLASLHEQSQRQATASPYFWPAGRELVYVVDVASTLLGGGLAVEVAYRERKKDGNWSKPRSQRIARDQVPNLPDPADRQIVACLLGAREHVGGYAYPYYGYYDTGACRYQLSSSMQETLIALMCRTGRCLLRRSSDAPELPVLQWDDGPPWEFWLVVRLDDAGKEYQLMGQLRRGEERQPLAAPVLLVSDGLVFWPDTVARLQDFQAFDWISLLRKHRSLAIPVANKDDFLKDLLRLPHLPRLDLPEEMRFEELTPAPRPRLKVKPPERRSWGADRLRGELSFDYAGTVVDADQPGQGIYQADQRRFLRRDPAAEAAAADRLRQLGFRRQTYYGTPPQLELTPRNLPRVVRELLQTGWQVEAEGKVYRRPGPIHIAVSSGIDWFELHGTVDFEGKTAALPELLAALKRGENSVRLDDGSLGMLPEDWLKKYGLLAGLGRAEGDSLRFGRNQVGLLDALLASQPEATCDEVFNRLRDELRHFEGIEPADPPAGFVGRLRPYQREGLGWLYFLQRFGFGGCLADDMGLGKTVQVLALLESRRELRTRNQTTDRPAASLVVVPRSLVFNWKQEAARFTPALRILDHTGVDRVRPGEHFDNYDVVLTTYGTLRRDAIDFKDQVFDYCILDESQAIKNPASESAKAARLIRADHRLALSGTPVENHLGELWSLFEFLNPGMLGSAAVFRLGGTGARNPSAETRTLLARALRPFILRRTKQQVARDLPAKLEQTIYCELEPEQRRLYDELREHYRQALLARVERDGINKAKMQILEALLRLRQAACHPGLLDRDRAAESSAKLDVLLPQLAEVMEEGHKALVFSQFTSLLAIVRNRLDRDKIPYEYLDGKTRDRAARVERFQSDPDCRLFLVSLKAGGLGLNLTAAEYVFLLDPWWNPAVEAQAIDRTHRIGQTQQVFAYRLIARDTVEEKVLELQQTKRDLADAIINADNSVIRNLGREDLELLLS